MYHWGVNVPTAIAAHALIIVIASILIGTRFGFTMTGLVAATVIGLWYFQSKGIVLIHEEIFTGGDAAALALLYCIIMVVSWLSNREIERSLFRARRSERELKEERDLLEVRVEERTRDLQKAQFEKVENVHRLAEFGELASGLFHDLINLVTAILPKAEVGEHEHASHASASDSGGANVEVLTDRVKDFTDGMRRQLHEKGIPEFFSVDDAVARAMQLLSYEARREKVRFVFDGLTNARIFGDPFRFHHVATNLIANAIESYRSVSDAREKIVWISVRETSGAFLMVVRDSGCGMPEDIQKKIFEPFFTMKTGGSGLGIGLAVVKRIVERDFGGTISVVSIVGRGSTFTVSVPITRRNLPDEKK
jgi:C4-dicarboxylate-specific signal transduction histidine kinase